ncbi:SulP family inorganic anion transporter [Leptospira sp. 'Mane']|uniref:SulP family inorganic anion transporter n=1 Tax=Leptospira sp. 'Mane' TaxID=3387407 RepID=UPI00398AC9A5
MKINFSKLYSDLFAGSTATFVALPAAIAFGINVYSPLGQSFAGQAALSGVIGTIIISLITPLLGGTPRLVSAPCAPAAAVLSVFVLDQMRKGQIGPVYIPLLVAITILFAGGLQILLGFLGGGKLIKYIPYPVVTGYLSGLGILIIFSQLPRFLGMSSVGNLLGDIDSLQANPIPPIIGITTILGMVFLPKLIKRIPPSVMALVTGVLIYWVLSFFYQDLRIFTNNRYIVGAIIPEGENLFSNSLKNFSHLNELGVVHLKSVLLPGFTLALLLSIDSLKTCLIIDVYSKNRHDSNRELVGQGWGNCASSLFGGIAGAGTLAPTIVNIASGAKSKWSGFFVGLFSLITIFFFAGILKWIPVSALAAVLIVVGFRMIDWKSVGLLKNKSTVFDFFVILCVVVAAISTSLILAAGVGIGLAILLFLREQIRSTVIRRHFLGNQKFSKKRRLPSELEELEKWGSRNSIFELQGQLFFGTTDQLFHHLEPYLQTSKNIILDFRRVIHIDFSAVNLLKQIHSRLQYKGGTLILTCLPGTLTTGQEIRNYLNSLGLTDSTPNLKFFDELDDALEFIEEEIIAESNLDSSKGNVLLHLDQFEFFEPFPKDLVLAFEKFTRSIQCLPGESVFHKGDINDEMFFIRKGEIRIDLPLDGNRMHHLATFAKGDFFGDMAFLDKEPRSANAIAVDECLLYGVSRAEFDLYVKEVPEFGNLFFESLAYTLSKRLRLNHLELTALQEN